MQCAANSSPKIFGPSYKRIEGLSLAEQNELKGAAWFQAGIPREISLEVLSRQSPGAFLVRQSSTKQGCFALSLRVPPPAPKVAHYLILRTSRGYKIKVILFFLISLVFHTHFLHYDALTLKIIHDFNFLLIFVHTTGFHKRIFITSSSHNASFGNARIVASSIVIATASKYCSTTATSGRF